MLWRPVGSGNDGTNSVNVSWASGTANVAVADFRATNHAVIDDAAVSLTGDLNVKTDSNSYANATVAQGNSLGFYSAVLTTVMAFADGDFKAGINAGGKEIKAANITVDNTYDAQAQALSAVAEKGLTASLVGVGINIAYAEASPTADAYIESKIDTAAGADKESKIAPVTASGDITVQVTGTGKADASFIKPTIEIGGMNIAINVVVADLTGSQTARIDDVDVKAGNVTIESKFNEGKKDVAAEATQGVGGEGGSGFKLSGISVEANTAVARANTKANATSDNAKFDLTGNLETKSTGNAVSHAGISGGSSATLLGFGLMVTDAQTDAEFKAVMTNSRGIKARNLDVETKYTAKANAETAQAKEGVKLALADITTNISNADVGVKSKPAYSGQAA